MTQCEQELHEHTQPEISGDEEPAAAPEPESSGSDAELWQERALRYAAEAENVRRRAEKELASARDYAVERFAKDMTAALDQLHLAANAAERSESEIASGAADAAKAFASLAEGVRLTLKEMTAAMERSGVSRFVPTGEKFDPMRCQAVMQRPATNGTETGVVLETFAAGYTLKDRLLKPAMVVVSGS